MDFGSSIIEDDSDESGMICAAMRVMNDFDRQYRAVPADDCTVWVLLINVLWSPTSWAEMLSE